MLLNDDGPIAGGRGIWRFPKKLAEPQLRVEKDTSTLCHGWHMEYCNSRNSYYEEK
tara:strand:+ start:1163 stop:1330 length:168 start_codon:yes stop_codon:yes gene_type:complete